MFEGLDPVDRLIARSRQLAQVQAELMQDLIAVAKASPAPEFAAMEIAAALTWTRQHATAQLELAHDLVVRLPQVHKALGAADIDLAKGRVIAEAVGGLDIPTARVVCDQILPVAPELTTGQLRARLAKLVIEADPDGADRRHRFRVAGRRVVLQPESESCASLCAHDLPADKALAASNRIGEIARQIKRAGDPRSMDQLRADTMLDLLLGRNANEHISCAGTVELVASLETLAGLADAPGSLAGFGPVVANIARRVAAQQQQGRWSFTIHDGATGTVHTGVTRRRPSAELARHVRQRDRTCRAPGCRVPASRCDLDHTISVQEGGLTTAGNLGPGCRYHHRGKHEGGWKLVQPRPGHFIWTSPFGKVYKIKPEPP